MGDSDTPGNPLDAERARLRQKGFSDSEISRILIERETRGGGTDAPAPPQGVFSNFLSSVFAGVGYAAGLFTSIRADLATMLDRSAASGVRVGAAAMVAIKGIVIGLLIYAGAQEWQQHIVNQTKITDAQAEKLRAEAKFAEQQQKGQADKQKAEGNAAEVVAGGSKAQACAESLKLLGQNLYLSDLNPDFTIKPGTATARMHEQYRKECGDVTGDKIDDIYNLPKAA